MVPDRGANKLNEKKMISEKFIEENFPELWKYIKSDVVTDVDFNCGNLWISTVDAITHQEKDEIITEQYMREVARSISTHTGIPFNVKKNRMFVSTEILRVTCVHESVSYGQISVCLRKEIAELRFTEQEAIQSGFCSQETYNLLRNCIQAHKNINVCGIPHTGKTETVKKFSGYIPLHEKVITIEDVAELHYSKIYPMHNCVELKTGEDGFRQCINDSLRMNPSWIIFGEAIGQNTAFLLETWSNGVSTISTTHTNDTRDIADKVINSADLKMDSERVINQVYKNLGVAVLMKKKIIDGNKIKRYIDQLTFYYRKDGKNGLAMVVKDGILRPEKMPNFIKEEIEKEIGRDVFSASPIEKGMETLNEEKKKEE